MKPAPGEPALFAVHPSPSATTVPGPQARLGTDARRTWERHRRMALGQHPIGAPIHSDVTAVDPDTRTVDGPTCGTCNHLVHKRAGGWTGTKCGAFLGPHDGPDIRAWWPACTNFAALEAAHQAGADVS